MSIPLLLVSDAPTSGTGLGRVTHDLATRIATHLPDVFRLGTLGYGGLPSRSLPFVQYPWEPNNEWIIHELPEVWEDFAGKEQGIVMTIWDASRLLWFSRPENCTDQRLRNFLTKPPFKRFGYWPIDATGPHNKLTAILGHTISGYDRCLCYSNWAMDILKRTLNEEECRRLDLDWRPHGINTSVFKTRHRATARHGFGERIGAKNRKGNYLAIPDDALLVGIVATNQARKDFGLGIQVVAELKKERPVMLWIHTDVLERHWSVPALLNDFGIAAETVVTCIPLSDDQMAWCYSACDVTLGIGNGEGYGYPIFESLACGTPCIHGNYGGAAEHLPNVMTVEISGEVSKLFRIEGVYNCLRPIYDFHDWVSAVNYVNDNEIKAELPPHLDWNNLWPRWEEWFRRGVA